MDAFGPRDYASEALAEAARQRRELLQEPLADIPAEVPRGYVPSGGTEGRTVPILVGAGVVGVALGLAAAAAIRWGGLWVLGLFVSGGGCLQIFILGGILAYFLSPFAVGLTAGTVLTAAGPAAGCRSPQVGERVGWGVGLLAAAGAAWMVVDMAGGVAANLDPVLSGLEGGSVWGTLVGIGTALASTVVGAKSGFVYGGIVGLLTFLMVAGLASGAGEHPYCESSGSFMERKVVGRFPLEQVGVLLRGLFHGNAALLATLESLPVDETPDDKVARLDLAVWRGRDGTSNLVEVDAHFFQDGKTKAQRRLFSEMFRRDQVETLAQALGVELGRAAGDASP